MGPTAPKARPAPQKKEIGQERVDRLINRRTFEPYDKPTVGCRYIRFTIRGEDVVGQLGFPIKNWRQGTSYPLQLENGEIVELVGNRLLHKLIKEGELCGQRVQIVYQGRDFASGGPWRFHKVYRVYKIGHKRITKEMWNKIVEKAKRIQNGKGK